MFFFCVSDPVTNLTVESPHWINQGDEFFVNVQCEGTAQFEYCIKQVNSSYDLVGNETCDSWSMLDTCNQNFSITHHKQQQFSEYSVSFIVTVRNAISIDRQLVNVKIRQSIILVAIYVGVFVFLFSIVLTVICCTLQCIRQKKKR